MTHWLEGIFQFLFKYRSTEFAKGNLAFGAPFSVVILLLAVAAIGIPAVLSYAGVRGKSSRRDRWVLGAVRVAALLVLVACLFRPMLLLSAAVPQRNYVGVLIDDSRSMRIADRDGKARADWVEHAFGGPDSSLLKALKQKFIVRLFRFSSNAQRVDSIADLKFDDGETHLGGAIEQARQELDAVPLSGLVVLTDGADNSRAPIGDELLSLRSKSVPIFSVGLGAEKFDKDIEIRRVEASHSVLKGGALVADLLIRQHGFAGMKVPLVVEDGGRIVSRDSITLPPDGDVAPVRVTVVAHDAGARSFIFRIPVQPGEQVAQNNAQQALVDVRDGREKILYVEGEPRSEMRFIRAAVESDSNIQLVALQRTAENKFLRLDVDGVDELASGFPKTRAELFRYRAVIIGSIEASFFTHDQLAMLSEFVNARGGGLLMLGGRRSFSEGGYAGTPLADVMPVVVAGNAVADYMTFFADLKVALQPPGVSHAVAARWLHDAGDVRAALEDALPPVTSVNHVREVKPGAVHVLISGSMVPGGRAGEPGRAAPQLRAAGAGLPTIWSRSLRSRSRFRIRGTWQMDPTSTAVDDATFERFLATDASRWITTRTCRIAWWRGVAADGSGEPAKSDHRFAPRSSTASSSRGTTPRSSRIYRVTTGTTRDLPLDWAIDRDGEYRGTFTPEQPGIYTVRVDASFPSGGGAGDTTYLRVADLNTEYFDAEMRAPLLKRMASETGGKYYTPATASTLADDVALSKHGVTVVNQMDLWDMPAIFLLLVALVTRRVVVSEGARPGMIGEREARLRRHVVRLAFGARISACRVLRSAAPAQSATHLIIVSGLGGEKKYTDAFAKIVGNARRRGANALRPSGLGDSTGSARTASRSSRTSRDSRRKSTSSAHWADCIAARRRVIRSSSC